MAGGWSQPGRSGRYCIVGVSRAAWVAAALLFSGGGMAIAADPASMIVVFDGSGSMWGKLDGERQTKFVNARDALKPALSTLKADARVGLMSYGHRRQADCSDVQLIVPAEGGTSERIHSILEKLNPKGKGPISAALKEAAKVLGKGPGKRSVILVHDDPDNCGVDACSIASELQAMAPGLVVHSIGLGLKPEDAQKMQCLTRATGGKLIDARTAMQVNAGIEEVVRLASFDVAPVAPAPVSAVRPATGPAVAVMPNVPGGGRAAAVTEGPPALRLATLLTGETVPGPRPVRWQVGIENGADVAAVIGQDVVVPLAAGRYIVIATDGLVEKRETVVVGEKGQTRVDVALQAGTVRLPQASAADADTLVMLSEAGAAAGARGRTFSVRLLKDLPSAWTIAPGKYAVNFEQGGARWQQAIEVVAGGAIDLSAVRPFGRLQVSVGRPNAATAAKPPLLLVMIDDPDAPRGLREIARSVGFNADFTLPAGTYAVIARQGALEMRDRLAVNAGETVLRTLTFGGATLSLSSRLAGGGAVVEEPVSYRISRVDIVPPQDITSVQATPQLDLPAGRYRIEARHGLINARAARDIDLTAGQKVVVVLEQQAGHVMLQPPPGHQGEVFWQILDAERHVIWGTAQSTPRATLQAGRYFVRAETRGKSYERAIDLKAGQMQPVQLGE